MSDKDILITGGRGRLARLISDWYSQQRYGEVKMFSRQETSGMLPLGQLFEPGGLDQGAVLLHLAWSALPLTAEQQPLLSAKHDLPLLQRLLAGIAALPAQRRPHLIFFSSGGAVYGNAPGRPNQESDGCLPIGEYGRAKRVAEVMIESWAAQHHLGYTILRVSNPYGYKVPIERPQGLIPRAIMCSLTGSPMTIWGDGSAQKDYLYYTDMLAALAAVIAARPVGTFNLCSGQSHSIREVLGEVQRQTGKFIPLTYALAAPWDVHDSCLANDRLRAILGWNPTVGLAEGIHRSVVDHPS
jgi:UDP-glucose 4-epimerase